MKKLECFRSRAQKSRSHCERLLSSGRQDFSPLTALGLKILKGGGILQKPLPAAQACGCFCLLFA